MDVGCRVLSSPEATVEGPSSRHSQSSPRRHRGERGGEKQRTECRLGKPYASWQKKRVSVFSVMSSVVTPNMESKRMPDFTASAGKIAADRMRRPVRKWRHAAASEWWMGHPQTDGEG